MYNVDLNVLWWREQHGKDIFIEICLFLPIKDNYRHDQTPEGKNAKYVYAMHTTRSDIEQSRLKFQFTLLHSLC